MLTLTNMKNKNIRLVWEICHPHAMQFDEVLFVKSALYSCKHMATAYHCSNDTRASRFFNRITCDLLNIESRKWIFSQGANIEDS